MSKIKLAVLYGGKSSEHEVSIISAQSVMEALDKNKYEIIPLFVEKIGEWPSAELLRKFDVVFPVTHGTFGEDGCLQGYLELVGVPYIGCGVLGSAVGMDKIVQKQILRSVGISVVDWVEVRRGEWTNREKLIKKIKSELELPVFVKPVNNGSSVGISKVKDWGELEVAIEEAFKFDRKVLVERAVNKAREIECSVLGNDEPRASVLGEIVPSNEFYDYNAKYLDGKSGLIIPSLLLEAIAVELRQVAEKVFYILNCRGMSRVDFLMNGETGEWWLNEINTIPGFTSISMYPKLWEASGLKYSELLDELVALALEK
jgi:D-alanine-D-alanine ligase